MPRSQPQASRKTSRSPAQQPIFFGETRIIRIIKEFHMSGHGSIIKSETAPFPYYFLAWRQLPHKHFVVLPRSSDNLYQRREANNGEMNDLSDTTSRILRFALLSQSGIF